MNGCKLVDKKTSIERLQLQHLFSATATSKIVGTLLAAVLAYKQQEAIATIAVVAWFSMIIFTSLVQAALVIAFQRTPAEDYSTTHSRLVKFRLGILLSGLVWGSAGQVLFPANDSPHQMFLMLVLAGITSGALISYAVDLVSALGFSMLVLVPLATNLFVSKDSLSEAMGVAITLYLGFVFMSARNMNRHLIENISMRLEATTREEVVRASEEVVRASEERYRLLLTHTPVGIFHYDTHLVITYCNERFAEILHNSSEHFIGLDMSTLKDQTILPCIRKAITGEIGYYEGSYFATLSNTDIYAEMTCAPFRDGTGRIVGGIAIVHDISSRKQADAELRIAATAFESQEGMQITDAQCALLRVNNSFTNITGYTVADVIGKNPSLLSSGKHSAAFYAAMWESINSNGTWEGEIQNRRKNGEIFPAYVNITAVKDSTGAVTNYVSTLTDITLKSEAAEKIKHLAFYDSLTGLPNRRLLTDRLHQAFSSSARSGREGALLFIDLDNFKDINDTLGHDIGDLLLQQTAQRLLSCMRESDTVARMGGDEFVVMLEELGTQEIESATQTKTVAEKILTTLNQSYQLASHEYHCTASIGAAIFSDHQQSREELLKRADIALYQAKKAGRNTMRFFNPKMQEVINARTSLESELRKALDSRQLELYYQIQVDSTHHALGAEALIRWLHPERGLVSPLQFIPLAEDTGLILPIGQWVLETACAQIKLWEQDALTRDLVLAVNVSAKQFHQGNFVAQVKVAVQRHTINPNLLKLELTESMLLDNIEDTIATMNELKGIGIQFSLDDFGTGYSSLQYLKRLPLDQLKIDQSFVRDIATDSSDNTIVRTIIAMAHSLDIDVIAEGVEMEDQRQLLLDSGCNHYQGYLFGKPVPIGQFEELLKQERSHG
jgi:diguanylate cyclase (GGDEF)-like protein/PAS domain S-box-containing protein